MAQFEIYEKQLSLNSDFIKVLGCIDGAQEKQDQSWFFHTSLFRAYSNLLKPLCGLNILKKHSFCSTECFRASRRGARAFSDEVESLRDFMTLKMLLFFDWSVSG